MRKKALISCEVQTAFGLTITRQTKWPPKCVIVDRVMSAESKPEPHERRAEQLKKAIEWLRKDEGQPQRVHLKRPTTSASHKSVKMKGTMETQRNPNEPGKSGRPGQQGGKEQDHERQGRERK